MVDLMLIMAMGWLATVFLFMFLLIRSKKNVHPQVALEQLRMAELEAMKKRISKDYVEPELEAEPEQEKDVDFERFVRTMTRLEKILGRIEKKLGREEKKSEIQD